MTDEGEDRVAMKLAVPQSSPLGEHWQVAQLLARSHYFKDTTGAPDAFTKILAGAELGFGPIASMKGVFIVNDQVTYSSNLIAAAIQKSGKYRYRVTKLDKTGCAMKFYERSGERWEEVGESTFGPEDATAAKSNTKAVYQQFPRNMYFARALTNGARWYCAEVFGGPVYTPDEFGASVDDDGEVIQIPAAPPMDTAEQKRNAAKYVEIHGDDGTGEEVQALLIQNAKLLQEARDLGVPGLRQLAAQSTWSVEKIEAVNGELEARIRERAGDGELVEAAGQGSF